VHVFAVVINLNSPTENAHAELLTAAVFTGSDLC